MANRENRLVRAARLMGRDIDEAAGELLRARRRTGLTQQAVAKAIGVSHQTVGRAERGAQAIDAIVLARHAAAVGLRARLKLYPEGSAIRDAGQIALIRRFRAEVGVHGDWSFEVPVPVAGDQRAVDAVIALRAGRVALEFMTRLSDVQAQLRAANLKKRDAELDRLVVVVLDSRTNRRVLREAGPALAEFPAGRRRILAAIRAGEVPPADGVILF